MPAPHRIRRQRWTVRTATAAQALAVRKRLRDEWEPVLLPAFARAFDAAAPGDAVVRIPRLEIRLRVDDGDGWMDGLAALIHDAVAEQLRALAVSAGPAREA
ncbi:MAG TPA: contractile injection system tape measure protein, partial [Longimicrobium sp.]